jgi:hypothetical protein
MLKEMDEAITERPSEPWLHVQQRHHPTFETLEGIPQNFLPEYLGRIPQQLELNLSNIFLFVKYTLKHSLNWPWCLELWSLVDNFRLSEFRCFQSWFRLSFSQILLSLLVLWLPLTHRLTLKCYWWKWKCLLKSQLLVNNKDFY